MVEAAIKSKNLSIGYRSRTVLENINFEIPHSTVTIIIGANGTGKSTLLKTLAGSLEPVAGHVLICNKNINDISKRERAQKMSIVYTDRVSGTGGLTVRELVEMGRYPHTGPLGNLSSDDREIVERALENVGIQKYADKFLSDISDGERQKAMIARALAQQTPVILLDEPTSFLDVASRLDLLGMIKQLALKHGRTILLSTHDTAPALAIADQVLAITPGIDESVTLISAADPSLPHLMNRVFPDRGIIYDPSLLDFKKLKS